MASLPLRLKITPQTLAPTALRPLSSSPFPDQNPSFNGENDENLPSPKSSHASLFSDIKERLRSPPSPPRRIPCDPPPPSIASSIPNPATSFKEIRKYLDGFRLRSSPSMLSRNPNPLSQDGPTSFKEIRKYLDGFRLRSSPSMPSRNPNPLSQDGPPSFEEIHNYFEEIRKQVDGFSLRSSPSMPSRNPNPPSEDGPTSFEEIRNSFEENRKHLAGFSLRSSPSMPSRNPNPPSQDGPTSFEEIRKHLAGFSLRSSPSMPSGNPNPPSQDGPISFQDLLKNRNNHQDPNSRPERGGRDPLRQSRPSPWDPPRIGIKRAAPAGPSLIGDRESLPESIFGREMREEKVGEWEAKKLRTEFAKMYGYDELGEKLRMLRPENAEKGGKNWFSLEEINLRLAKLRELEDKEAESGLGGLRSTLGDLRESLMRIKDAENARKSSVQCLSILSNIGLQPIPSFMHELPQEQLLENYCHPDHMSSAEKLKLELKKETD